MDNAVAMLSLACLAAFLGIVVWFVPDVDLTIVVIVTVVMAAYDFFLTAIRNRRQ